jgi:PAS domain S-box-containing protein
VDSADWGLLDLIPDAALAFTGDTVAAANGPAADLFGIAKNALTGMKLEQLLREGSGELRSALKGDHARATALRADGTRFPAELSLRRVKGPWGTSLVAVIRDMTAEMKADSLKAAEKSVLEMIAARRPLEEILDQLARSMESVSDGMIASILLVTEDGYLTHGAGPSLPAEYIEAIRRVPIAPNAGSCGTSAFTKEMVVVRDIATDKRWESGRDVTMASGLRACWSNPIIAADGSVLGTFALYYREPREPADDDLTLVQRATHLAGIAIERDRVDKLREATEGRYRTLAELTSDFAYAFSFDEDGFARVDWITDAFTRITGFDKAEWEERGAWRGILHPEDVLAFEQRLPKLSRGEEVSADFRIITKSGDVRWLSVYSRPIMSEDGSKLVGVVGAAQDFTTRKEAEDAKTMFLATASHELKTPLTVIHGFAQLMGDSRVGGTNTEREAA